jgi:DNA-binding transcriptional MerR regulator
MIRKQEDERETILSPSDEGSGEDTRTYTISELSEELDITARAIRFYEARDLIRPKRTGSSRIYSAEDRQKLVLILRGKNLGFSLEDIREFLHLYDADPKHEASNKLLLEKVETQIKRLEEKRADTERSLRELKDLRARTIEKIKAIGAKKSNPA